MTHPVGPAASSPVPSSAAAAPWSSALGGLAERILGPLAAQATFTHLTGPGRRYAYTATESHLTVEASDASSAAVGLHQYLREQCRMAVSWDDLRPPPPERFPDVARTEGRARVEQTYYLNFCTFGYTSVWWDWQQWEQEIDWMALRGVSAPLMMVGHEAVLEQVLRQEGLSAARVEEFLAGPAYLPWSAMGTLEGFAGPPPAGWIAAHRDLAGQILTRQRELGMRPVLPAFTGHVPAELAGGGARDWQGHRTHVVGPEDPAFRRMAAATVRVQQEFWGTDHRYASDPFIEMIPVESDPDYPGRVAAALLAGLTDADPEAIWFLQTWPFSYQEQFWTQERVRTFLAAIDPDRLVLLDLWAEAEPQWQRFDGFEGRAWMWCALLNFGGRNEPLGDLRGVTARLEEALTSAHPPTGAGLSMEATRAVPVFFERVLDATWQPAPPLEDWLADWTAQRYRLPAGPLADRAAAAWHGLARTVLASGSYRIFPEAFTGLLTQRPPADPFAEPGLLRRSVAELLWYEPADLIEAWRALVEVAEELPQQVDGPLGRDLVEVALGVLPRYGELSFLAGYDHEGVRDRVAAQRFFEVFDDLQALLATRPEFRYDQWESQALRWAASESEARLLADNARRLVTVWARSGDGYLDDYSARYWAGLLGYYRQRWHRWAQLHPIGADTAEELEAQLLALERDFLREGPITPPAQASVVAESRRLLEVYGPLFVQTADQLRSTPEDDDGAHS